MELVVIAIIALVGFWLFLFVFKRGLRMALRLAVLGAIIPAVLAGAVAWRGDADTVADMEKREARGWRGGTGAGAGRGAERPEPQAGVSGLAALRARLL